MVNLIFFLSGLTFHEKNETLGDNGDGNVIIFFLAFKLSVCIIVGLVVIKAPFLSLRTLGICCLVLLAGGVSIMSRLLCLKNVALAVSVSVLSLFSLDDTQDHSTCSHESRSF